MAFTLTFEPAELHRLLEIFEQSPQQPQDAPIHRKIAAAVSENATRPDYPMAPPVQQMEADAQASAETERAEVKAGVDPKVAAEKRAEADKPKVDNQTDAAPARQEAKRRGRPSKYR